jgi:signal peptidase II
MAKGLLTRERLLYSGLFLLILVADQVTKLFFRSLPLGEKHPFIPGVLWITHLENTGASFSMFSGSNTLLIFVALIVLGGLLYFSEHFKSRLEKISFALIVSGLLGNLIDRIFLGSVTDFLDLGWWPVFNIADSALVIGVAFLIVKEIFYREKK